MRDVYLHSKQSKICRLVRWIPPKNGWYNVNTNGVVSNVFGNDSAGGLIHF